MALRQSYEFAATPFEPKKIRVVLDRITNDFAGQDARVDVYLSATLPSGMRTTIKGKTFGPIDELPVAKDHLLEVEWSLE